MKAQIVHARKKVTNNQYTITFCTGRNVFGLAWGKPQDVTCKACLKAFEKHGTEGAFQ